MKILSLRIFFLEVILHYQPGENANLFAFFDSSIDSEKYIMITLMAF
jgi:hypothetical protein